MIIRSADKESIINFDTMSMVQMEEKKGKFTIYAYDSGATVVTPIATYSTREQAIDVLDKLQYSYSHLQKLPSEVGNDTIAILETIAAINRVTFELPPDDPEYLEHTED